MGILWEHSNTLEWSAGAAAAGALAYFYTGGTTTPLVVYSDAGEAIPTTTPVVADANGRWPNVFIPFIASYDVKVTTSGGTQLYYPTLIPNPNPVTAATGTVSTSSSQVFQTGGMRFEIQDASMAAPSGWVRCNRNSIGNATSGATERANADASALFTFLWNIQGAGSNTFFPVVSAGTTTTKGATAAADFGANKGILLPDMRGGGAIGVSAMGGTESGRLATATFTSGTATLGGSLAGENVHTLITAELAQHTHPITATMTIAGDHSHQLSGNTSIGLLQNNGVGFPSTGSGASAINVTVNNNGDHVHPIAATATVTGSGTPHNVVSFGTLGTWLIKLGLFGAVVLPALDNLMGLA